MIIEEQPQKISFLGLNGNLKDPNDFQIQRIVDENPIWFEQFFYEGCFEKPWGVQGFFFLKEFPYKYYVNGNFFPPKIGYAVIDGRKTGFSFDQNRHLHLKNNELVVLWSREKGNITIEINGENTSIDSNFGIFYIPSGIPHNLIFNGPSITVDLKRLVFGHREDNLAIDEKNDPYFSGYSIYSYCLFDDKVYSIPWFITNEIPDYKILEEIQRKTLLNHLPWGTIIFYPEIMLDRPTDFYSFYKIVSLSDLYKEAESDDRFYLFFPWIRLIES